MTEQVSSLMQLDLRDRFDALEAARLAMRDILAQHAVDARAIYKAELVLEELLMNVILHACVVPEVCLIGFAAGAGDVAVTMTVEDSGVPFDPTSAKLGDPARNLASAQPGSLGLLLARASVLDWTYARVNGRNRSVVRIARA